jgi:hypothetical protein
MKTAPCSISHVLLGYTAAGYFTDWDVSMESVALKLMAQIDGVVMQRCAHLCSMAPLMLMQ